MKKRISGFFRKNREAVHSHAGKIGGYSFVVTLAVLAILVLVNVMVRLLPSRFTQFDISAARLFSITSNTKVVVNQLEDDVTIYWITQSGEEDTYVERLLDVYDGLSSYVKVEKKNPDVYPTFAEKYTDEESVSNNSLVVECGDRYRFISYDEIYVTDTSSYYMTGSTSTDFDGEGQITAAINYVVTEDLPKLYVLTGHGEADLSDSFTQALNKQNVETEEFTLLNTEEIPEDCDGILIYAPTSDLSEKEVEILKDYLTSDGKLMVFSGPQEEEELEHLNSLLTDYGVEAQDGIVIEGDANAYAFGMPYLLLAQMNSSDITDPLIDESSNVIIPIAKGYQINTSETSSYTVTSLVDTSSESFSKLAGYDLNTYEKEDGDLDGPFSVGFSIEDETIGSKILWFGSNNLLDDTYDEYSSGANMDLAMNGLNWVIGENDQISIRSKSMDYNYLSISESQSSILKICMIGLIPGLYLLFGIDEVLRRRRRCKKMEEI